jgi:hypothetical protein
MTDSYARSIRFAGFPAIAALAVTIVLAHSVDNRAAAATPAPENVARFLEAHCLRCHGATVRKSGLRLDDLGTDFLEGRTADLWKEVIDRINLGEMPPADEPQPKADEAFAVVRWVNDSLREAERAAATAGRGRLRRLNRTEYAYTVGDLLDLPPTFIRQIREELPADGRAEGFDRIAAALFFDRTQLEKYLAAADLIAREAVQDAPPETARGDWKADPKQLSLSPTTKITDTDHEIPRGPNFAEPKRGGIEYISGKRTFQKSLDNAGWTAVPGAEIKLESIVRRDGYYRLRVRGGAFAGDRNEPVRLHFQYARDTPIEARGTIDLVGSLDEPGTAEQLVFLRAGRDEQKASITFQWNGIPDLVPANPELIKLVNRRVSTFAKIPILIDKKAPAAEIDALKRELDGVVKQLYAFTGPAYVYNPKYELATVPRLWLERIEIEGPIVDWPPPSHRALGYDESTPENETGLMQIFGRLLPRAYRRPVADEEIDRFTGVVARTMRSQELSFREGLRFGLKTLFCSPHFTFLETPIAATADTDSSPRRISDYELASRLSYLVWCSLPDDELVRLAAEGRLRNPAVLSGQVTRLLDDPKSQRFVEAFAGQWLTVDEFGSVDPAREYVNYDEALEAAERTEPLAFFGHVLAKNRPITDFLDSDYLVINERLAKHYGIDGVKGAEFRVVSIEPKHHRGGVLGMGGLLTLLSDGTRTLPVRRAAWVLETLLNDPPLPPPPNAGDIQPNTAGENLTVRERLLRHRNEPNCASCHVKLDPYGLALENYDAVGAWRTRQNGEGIRESRAPAIEVGGRLKSGRTFDDLAGFKNGLLAEKNAFARAWTHKLLTYALGRPIGYVDHRTVEAVAKAGTDDGFRIRAFLQGVIASEPFQTR